jgi:hypothetical protein
MCRQKGVSEARLLHAVADQYGVQNTQTQRRREQMTGMGASEKRKRSKFIMVVAFRTTIQPPAMEYR